MSNATPDWLPKLILLEMCQGSWELYLEVIYRAFHRDFVQTRPTFERRTVMTRFHPAHDNKGATFWHIISEGSEEAERTPDFRRCERICWPKVLIERADSDAVCVWETIRPWKNQKQKRINISLNDFSYIVVLAETGRGYDLVTAYYVERLSRREKLKAEFETSSRQKKEGSAV